MPDRATCTCEDPEARADGFVSTSVGIDRTNGRFGEVTIERCARCDAIWLRYLVEYEGFSKSGRWYRGLVTASIASTVTPETAVAVLEALPWHYYGGSYWESNGARSAVRRIVVDL